MMTQEYSFDMNTLFLDNPNLEKFWYQFYQKLKEQGFDGQWPFLMQRPEHLVDELRSYFEHNGIYDELRKNEEIITVVFRERKAYQASTFKVGESVKVTVPKNSWYIRISPKEYIKVGKEWRENPTTLQNTAIFVNKGAGPIPEMWGDTLKADGIVHIVERFKLTADDLNPSPINLGDLLRG